MTSRVIFYFMFRFYLSYFFYYCILLLFSYFYFLCFFCLSFLFFFVFLFCLLGPKPIFSGIKSWPKSTQQKAHSSKPRPMPVGLPLSSRVGPRPRPAGHSFFPVCSRAQACAPSPAASCLPTWRRLAHSIAWLTFLPFQRGSHPRRQQACVFSSSRPRGTAPSFPPCSCTCPSSVSIYFPRASRGHAL